MGRLEDLDRLYELVEDLRARLGGCRLLSSCTGTLDWPRRGLYFFFEDGELRAGDSTRRVVRVGTHALTATSKTTLWNRLSQHRGTLSPVGGNHRGSIFRRHIGEALLLSGRSVVPATATWGCGSSAPRAVTLPEQPLEAEVSAYLGAMPFLWLETENRPDGSHERGYLEKNTIALLSNFDAEQPLDPPSPTWLGLFSSREEIRRSGLWNVNHVSETYDPGFLMTLQAYITRV